MCALAFRNMRQSSLQLYHRAKSVAAGIRMMSINQTPNVKPYMQWLARVAGADEVHVYARDTGRVYTTTTNCSVGGGGGGGASRVMRLICWNENVRRPSYSLLLTKKCRVYYCRRCRRATFGTRDRIKHAALCSKRHANQFMWNRKGMLALQNSTIPPQGAKQAKATRIRFIPGTSPAWTVTTQRLIENLGIRGFGHLFQRNTCLVCIDCEAALAKSGSSKTDLVQYSANFAFCNIHNLLNVGIAYRICGQRKTRVRIFWVSDTNSPRDVLTSLVKFLNILSDVNYKRMCSGPFKPLLERLDEIEDRNVTNGFLCKQVTAARRKLLQYLRALLCVGYNIGSYLLSTYIRTDLLLYI
ncbi:MAG: hypothetical protein GY740_09610 [Gammaproteobacteria bacterium]|nr:hypothetical protein [Gammaproteobacteria bacterium]